MAVLLLVAPAHAEPESPFTYTIAELFDKPGNPIAAPIINFSNSLPSFSEAGSAPLVYSRSRAEFGSIGFELLGSGPNFQPGGGAFWSDSFQVNGGNGTLTLSTVLDGTVSGDADMGFAVFASSQRFDMAEVFAAISNNGGGEGNLQLPNATRVMYTAISNACDPLNPGDGCSNIPYLDFQGAFNVTLTGSLAYTDGEPFYLISLMGGNVNHTGGALDFFNTASFGITVPAGATLVSGSGTVYAAAAPIPEPSSWLMLLMGLGLMTLAKGLPGRL